MGGLVHVYVLFFLIVLHKLRVGKRITSYWGGIHLRVLNELQDNQSLAATNTL